MVLSLTNIGKISSATIKLDGITVIAGENSSGKSTVGKALFSVVNGSHNIVTRVATEKRVAIAELLERLIYEASPRPTSRASSRIHYTEALNNASEILRNYKKYVDPYSLAKDLQVIINSPEGAFQQLTLDPSIESQSITIDPLILNSYTKKIVRILNKTDEEITARIMTNLLQDEFKNQIVKMSVDEDHVGQIKLDMNSHSVTLEVTSNSLNMHDQLGNMAHNIEAVFIDDPFILERDNISGRSPFQFYIGRNAAILSELHRQYCAHPLHLYRCLTDQFDTSALNAILIEDQLYDVFNKLNTVCDGSIERKKDGYYYRDIKTGLSFNMSNVSTGIKSFAIIKTLLMHRVLSENNVLILDEPEIHLHPEWQLVFAELLVLLQKELNLRILINTYSIDFLCAIEIFAHRHEILNKCNFYQAKNEGTSAIIFDVTDEIEKIYAQLGRALQRLEDMRHGHD